MFAIDGWTVFVYDYAGGSAAMTQGERATWARSLTGDTNAEGFLVLEANDSLALSRAGDELAPQLTLHGEHGSVTLSASPCRTPPPGAGGTLCFDGADASVLEIAASPEFEEAIRAGLRINGVAATP